MVIGEWPLKQKRTFALRPIEPYGPFGTLHLL